MSATSKITSKYIYNIIKSIFTQNILKTPYSKFNSWSFNQPFPKPIFACQFFGIDSLSKNCKCLWIQVDGHLK